MKKSYLSLAFFFTTNFLVPSVEPLLKFIQNPTCPEDYVENFLAGLRLSLTDYVYFNYYITYSVGYIKDQTVRWNRDYAGATGLRCLFEPPSDPERMEALRMKLTERIKKHEDRLLNGNPQKIYEERVKEGYQLLKKTLANEALKKAIASKEISRDDEYEDYGISGPVCTIL